MEMSDTTRFARQSAFFGQKGQDLIEATRVAVVGVGGLGTHVIQQLAYLGIRKFCLIDDEELDHTNLNRYVGARFNDKIPGTRKVDLGERIIRSIQEKPEIVPIFDNALSEAAFAELKMADVIFGCVDNEGTRLVLNELAAAYDRPYFDLSSEIVPGEILKYGGRVASVVKRPGCIACLGELDFEEAASDLADPNRRAERARLYGLDTATLGQSGPSVVSINGVVSSLAVTEFMVWRVGLRAPERLLRYRADSGKVMVSTDNPTNCFTCSLSGSGDQADVDRYLRNMCNGSRGGTHQ